MHSSLESFLQSYLTNCCTFVIGIFFTILPYKLLYIYHRNLFCNLTLQTAVHSSLESSFTILPYKLLYIHHWNILLQSYLTNCCAFIIGIFFYNLISHCCTFIIEIIFYNLTLQTAMHSSLESFLQSYLTNCCTFIIGIFFYNLTLQTAVHSSL